jgi:FkbM family methyltransferase
MVGAPRAGLAYRALRDAGEYLHGSLARHPRVANSYFGTWPWLRWLPSTAKARLMNSVAAVRWPEQLRIRPQNVTVGTRTTVCLRPHPGEFDLATLLHSRLDYERPLFAWLEQNLAAYETVLEVGANVGVFTVFFGQHQRERGGRIVPEIVAFEPSRLAFTRLLDNLSLNGTKARTHNCAVAARSGVADFHEPEGHLTNGSLRADFANIFSDRVTTNMVLVVDADIISKLLPAPGRSLLKIDVEGAEAEVLRGLRPWISKHRPDLIVEVLPGYADELRATDFLGPLGYSFFRIEAEGPVPVAPYEASASHRDHLLLAPRGGDARRY